jgi:two-component system chemotaxis sensor kinase CheA
MAEGEVDEVLAEFLAESLEGLDAIEQAFVVLEQRPKDEATLAAIFRTMHSLKGSSGFLGFPHLERLAHAAESLLAELRAGHLELTPEITTALLRTVDVTRQVLDVVERTGSDGDDGHTELVAELARLRGDTQGAAGPDQEPPPPLVPSAPPQASVPPRDGTAPVSPPAEAPTGATPVERAEESAGSPATTGPGAPSTIRVDVGLVDRLMTLVGELVLARNQVLQCSAKQQDRTLQETAQRLNLVTSELQAAVTKTRMQPIGRLYAPLPRVVRDLGLACGKRVELVLEGAETELDRTILEAVKDPLTHLVRNAVDHGLESPEERRAAGKPEVGQLRVRAFHEGGTVTVEVADDGTGIDPAAVRARAQAAGLLSAEALAKMDDRQVLELVFLPGFSTAATVTTISGRGVGMDVVRSNVERIGGTVDLQSTPGLGTTVRVKLPLTLAIIPTLVVRLGQDRYLVPQVHVLELVQLDQARAAEVLERIDGVSLLRLRDRLVPLVDLAEVLGLPRRDLLRPAEGTGTEGTDSEEVASVVVLQSERVRFGLLVDDVVDTTEIVVKPLGRQVQHLRVFGGVTIMGDGRLALILDVLGIVARAGLASGDEERLGGRADRQDELGPEEDRNGVPRATLLLLRAGTARAALPLQVVERLEDLGERALDCAGGREVLAYRGGILPLVRLADVVTAGAPPGDETDLRIVVIRHRDQRFGLVCGEIQDIVEEALELEPLEDRPGVAGLGLVGGEVTEILDVAALAHLARQGTRGVPVGAGRP